MVSFTPVLIASLLSFSLCGIGVVLTYIIGSKLDSIQNYMMYFASGVLISIAFLIMIPRAMKMNQYSPLFLLVGFIFIFFIDKFVDVYICGDESKDKIFKTSIIAGIGIASHSFIDGVIYSTVYSVSVFIGIAATVGMILHEFPEGIVTFSLFRIGKISKRKSLLLALLIAGATTPIGAIVSFPFIQSLSNSSLGIMLSISAGILVYVGASHLLPEAEEKGSGYSGSAFVIGVIIAILLWLVKTGAVTF